MAITVTPELILQVRTLAFSPTEEQISDVIIGNIIQTWINVIGDDDDNLCQILYDSLLSVLQYLWNKDLINQGNQSGGATGRTEKVGEIQVSQTWSSTSVYNSPWEGIYNKYLNGDLLIAGCSFEGRGIASKVIIGGVDRCEIHRVNSRPNSVNGLGGVASVDTRYPTKRFRGYRDLMGR